MPDHARQLLLDRWDDVDRLFGEALALAEEERPRYLEGACGGDTALLDTVQRLLAATSRDRQALTSPGTELLQAALGPAVESEPDALEPGDRIDRYRLLREVGRGGMATVYEAERADGAFDSRVAIKVLRRIDREVAARLVTERQILSSLTHPHIARLLDGGTTDDERPFLVMELVHGEPLTTWADRRQLDVPARLELFLQVVDAVQYAHTHLVVHRDIKPSNVLVDEAGEARLLDFGIAKLLDRDAAGHTRPATRWMTPEYASPEQVLGRPVTTAADIHALGVLLYELLAGHRPFWREGRAGFELERAICEETPALPSTAVGRSIAAGGSTREGIAIARSTTPEKLTRRLAGDLDAIVARCLRKVPGDRYQSARELEDDLRRHLTGFPVRAREGHRAYRARKFLKRHAVGVSAAAAVAVVLVGAGIALVRQQRQTAAQRDRAEAAAQRAETEAENARLVTNFLADVFRGRDPRQAPPDTVTARELLAWGVERVGSEFADRPRIQADLLLVLGDASANLGLLDNAVGLDQRAVDLRRTEFGPRSPQTADALVRLGALLRTQRDFPRAERAEAEAVEIRSEVDPESPELAAALGALANSLVGLRQYDSAIVVLRRATSIKVEGTGEEEALNLELTLAYALRAAGRLDEARAVYDEAIPAYRALPDHDDGQLAVYVNNLGYLRRVEGNFDGAAEAYREALDLEAGLVGRGHPNSVLIANNLAGAYAQGGHDAQALEVLRENLAALQAQYPDGHWRVGGAEQALGDALLRLDSIEGSLPHLQSAATMFERQLGPLNDWTSFASARVAVVRVLQGDTLEGQAFLDRLHAYLAGQELNVDQINLLERFLFTLNASGPVSEYARFRALHPDSVAVATGGAG